jgi:hypothetical protein
LGRRRLAELLLVLPGERHQCDEDQNGARQQNWPRSRNADRRDGSLPGERGVGRIEQRYARDRGSVNTTMFSGRRNAHDACPARANDQRGCQLGLSVKRPPSAKPMSYIRNNPNAKLIKPEATPSCQLNLGRL